VAKACVLPDALLDSASTSAARNPAKPHDSARSMASSASRRARAQSARRKATSEAVEWKKLRYFAPTAAPCGGGCRITWSSAE